jgi:hypothetical protein
MRANLAGSTSTFHCPLPVGLLMIVAISSCSLLKKKGDTGPDAQASAAVIASIAPIVTIPSVAPVATTAPVPTVVVVKPRTHTATSTGTGTAAAAATVIPSGAPIPPPIPIPTAEPTATASAPATPGIINPQCQQACQKGYQDCIAQSGGLTGMELIKSCRQSLMPCLQTCK